MVPFYFVSIIPFYFELVNHISCILYSEAITEKASLHDQGELIASLNTKINIKRLKNQKPVELCKLVAQLINQETSVWCKVKWSNET